MEKTIQVVRGGKVVHVAKPLTIRRFKDVVEKVGVGNDCGIQLIGCDDIREGDRLVAYDITPQWPTLEFMDADP
jgi:translation initiation factor IF-2